MPKITSIKYKNLIQKILFLCVITPPLFILITAFFLYRISSELESKFYAPINATPTKIYSRIFRIQSQQLISLEELVSRLKKRKYKEVPIGEFLEKGSFRLNPVEDEKKGKRIDIFLRDFHYPKPVKNFFFDEKNHGPESSDIYSVFLINNQINRIIQRKNSTDLTEEIEKKKEVDSISLEPILISRLNNNPKETREYITLEKIPYSLLQAIISVEDHRFLEHSGVDLKGILRSIMVNLKAGSYRQGASTITQQMARNLYLTREKTIRRKLKEIFMAIMIEFRYSKDEILEKYFNEVYFGQLGSLEIHGVSLAAKHYFGKSLQKLSIAEQAFLAGIVRGPSYYSPYRNLERAKKRQEFVLKKMHEEGAISSRAYKKALKEKLVFATPSKSANISIYFTDFVRTQLLEQIPNKDFLGTDYTVFSTIDPYYQNIVEEEVEKGILQIERNLKKSKLSDAEENEKKEAPPLQAVFILIEHKKNNILAVVGGRSVKSSIYNRALLMKRQLGSLIKPFVYLAGFMYEKDKNTRGPLNAISKLEDSPFQHKYDEKIWKPRNHKKEHLGTITVRHALANSINIPAARLAIGIGINKVADVAKYAGIGITDRDILPSLALGSADVAPTDLVKAFSTLANYGKYKELTSILLITDKEENPAAQFFTNEKEVLPKEEVANIVSIMRSVFTEGTAKWAKSAGFSYPAVGKTGTTNNYRDAWFVGFTNELLALAWVGYDRDNEETQKARTFLKLTGSSGALPLWINVMKRIYKNLPHQDINFPEGSLELLKVDIVSGALSDGTCAEENLVEEYFTKRNTPSFTCDQ